MLAPALVSLLFFFLTKSRLQFFINAEDSMQGSGRPKEYKHKNLQDADVSPNTIMASTLTALNMQLRTGLTIANCCSNFHKFMKEVSQLYRLGIESRACLHYEPCKMPTLSLISGINTVFISLFCIIFRSTLCLVRCGAVRCRFDNILVAVAAFQ